MNTIVESFKKINSNIDKLKPKKKVNIVAVSKTFSLEHIKPLIDFGHKHFGENKVQEAQSKWNNIKMEYKDLMFLKDYIIEQAQDLDKKVKESADLLAKVTNNCKKLVAYVKDKHIKNIVSENELDFETIAKERLIAGTPEQCLEQLKFWKEEIKPDYIMLRMRQPGGPSQTEALEDIRLFGEKVIVNL